MTNNLRQLARDLKAFAKRCKEFKYTETALFTFLLTGSISLASTDSDKAIENKKSEITTSIDDLRQEFKKAKLENNKLLKSANVELVQLMEQGDQVVKSPWASWQFGINMFSNSYNGKYGGKGDKTLRYDTQGGKFNRGNWWETSISTKSSKYQTLGKNSVNNLSLSNQRNNYWIDEWGLVRLKKDITEPIASIELSASVNPKTVSAIPTPIVNVPNIPQAPAPISVNPSIPTPPKAPVIDVPVVQPVVVEVGQLPTITAPTVTVKTIKPPTNPSIPSITLGSFSEPNLVMTAPPNSLRTNGAAYTGTLSVGNGQAGVGHIQTTRDGNQTTYNRGTINVSGSGSVGYGYIQTGQSSTARHSNQGVARYLNIVNDTIATLVNDIAGNINVSGQNSAGMLLIPEVDTDPFDTGTGVAYNGWAADVSGYSTFGDRDNVIQHADNLGTITVTGNNSYGLVTLPDYSHHGGASGDYNFGYSNTGNTDVSNHGTINVNATNSAAFALKEEGWAGNYGTVNVGVSGSANASAGMYNEMPLRLVAIGTQTDSAANGKVQNYRHVSFMGNYGTINLGSNSVNSAGLWVKNGGFASNRGTINVDFGNNYGQIAQANPTDASTSYVENINDFYYTGNKYGVSHSEHNGTFVKASNAVGAFAEGKSSGGNANVNIHGNGIFVGVRRNYSGTPGVGSNRYIDWNGDNGSVIRKADENIATGGVTNSIAVRLREGALYNYDIITWNTEQDYGRIITNGAGNHAVVAENNSYVDSSGLINNQTAGTIGVYLKDSYANLWNEDVRPSTGGTAQYNFPNNTNQGNGSLSGVVRDNGRLISGNGAIGIYSVGDDARGGEVGIHSGVIQVGDSTTNNTAIAVMTDGANHIAYGTGRDRSNNNHGVDKLDFRVGQNAIGIYSNNFENTTIWEHNKTKMKQGATFAYISGGKGNMSQFNNLYFDTTDSRYNNPQNTTLAYIADNAEFHFDSATTGSNLDLDGGFKTTSGTNLASNTATGLTLYRAVNSKIYNDANMTLSSDYNGNNLVSVSAMATDASGNSTRTTTSGGMLAQKTTVGISTTTPVSIGHNSTQAINRGIVNLDNGKGNSKTGGGTGIYTLYGTALNDTGGVINTNIEKAVAVFGDEGSITKNAGTINLNGGESVGLYARDKDGLAAFDTDDKQNIDIENTGTINVNADTQHSTSASSINSTSIGISTNNTSKNIVNSEVKNTSGTINLNATGAIGIYAPYSKVSKVGKIVTPDLDSAGNRTNIGVTVAVYGDKDSTIDTATGDINLGKNNQKQVAYYLKGDTATVSPNPDPTINTSTSLGTITGNGVGILVDDIKINNTNFVSGMGNQLDYTTGGNTGNGIIGLYVKGDVTTSNKLGYTGDIKVGASEASTSTPSVTNYAVALYTDKQGTKGSEVTIENNLTVGEKGVGLFAGNDSNLIYDTGTITVNTNSTGGTGIYVAPPTQKTPATTPPTYNNSSVHLKSNIVTNGDNAAGAIVGQNEEFTFDNAATMTFNGSGVAMYGFKDSIINDNGGTILNPNGDAVERIRTHGGRLDIQNGVTMTIPSGQILYHSENGQVNNDSGATITDGGITGNKRIGIYAEGHLDPTQIPYTNSTVPYAHGWNKATYDSNYYDGINQGDIDLRSSTSTVAIYANSADAINDKNATVKMGDQSVGIYGINNPNTNLDASGNPIVAPTAGKYTTKILNASDIEIGKNSVGMFGDGEYTDATGTVQNSGAHGIETIINDGKITANSAGQEAVGIYRRGDSHSTTSTIENKGLIDLSNNDGTVGIYGTTSDTATPSTITPVNGSGATRTATGTYKNEITNTGTIKVGNTITAAASPTGNEIRAVGIFAKNSKVNNSDGTTDGTIQVGTDGIVFAGDNSDITINGNIINPDGILAYADNESTVDYQLGTAATTSDEPLMYLLNGSTANMQGQDVNVINNATGVYVSGVGSTTGRSSSFDDFGKMTLGQSSNGIYGTNGATIITRNNSTIESSNTSATAIIADNTTVSNDAKINLSGDSSLGIYSANNTASSVTPTEVENTGIINITGQSSSAIYANGTNQNVINKGTINVGAGNTASTINLGIYGDAQNIKNDGTINIGDKSVGIYGTNTAGNVTLTTNSKLNISDEGTGVYKDGGTVDVAGDVNVGNKAIGIYGKDTQVTDVSPTNYNIADDAFGVVIEGTGSSYTSNVANNVTLNNDSIYVYGKTTGGTITNNSVVTTNGDRNMVLYGANNETIVNNANLNLQNGKGNIGIFTIGGTATNNFGKSITVGDSDNSTGVITYAIGMASKNGTITNDGTINLNGNLGIGMYANGVGAGATYDAINNGNIYLNPTTTGTPVTRQVGMYLENGARGVNYGYIGTNGVDYTGNSNVKNLVGVAVLGTSTFENHGTVEIDADKSSGIIVRGRSAAAPAIIKNYGTIKISGTDTAGVSYTTNAAAGTTGSIISPSNDHSEINGAIGAVIESNGAVKYNQEATGAKSMADITIETDPVTGLMIIKRNGVNVNATTYTPTVTASSNIGFSNVGVYIDTLGNTKPMDMSGYSNASSFTNSFDLVLGAEIAKTTNDKNILIQGSVLQPFNNWLMGLAGGSVQTDIYSGSLTWMATVASTGTSANQIAMAKIPYTFFVRETDNVWNFADGLEQRYGVEGVDSREKQVFNKLNSIGNNESELLAQSFDEMMGHQYANVQQRIKSTGDLLSYEFDHIKDSWETVSKDSNKIKVFGNAGEYKSNTAGIIDTTNKAYGVAYLHEKEGLRLGESAGWYAGVVNNKFDFKDLGGSKENTTLVKAGVYKSIPFDENNSLNWTISGDIFAARSEMDRKYLVVDEVFGAKSDYNSYGLALKNEIGKSFRLGENTSLRPYGALKLEYGRTDDIKEDSGEIRLEVDGNNYYSIKPEVGMQLNYKQNLGSKAKLNFGLGVAYENELGEVGNVGNKARVRYTTADYFDIRGEKDNRKGNIKADANLGITTGRFGLTTNIGYDTNGRNLRGGLGFRMIY